MIDIQTLIIVSALAVPLYLILKPLFAKTEAPHASGGKLLTGHTDFLLADPVNFMKELREKYGSLYSVDYMGKRVVVFGKQWIYELFKNRELEFEEAQNQLFLIIEAVGSAQYTHDPKLNNAKVVRSLITPYLKSLSAEIYKQITLLEEEIFEGKDSKLVESPAEIFRKFVVKTSSSTMLGSRLCEDKEIIEAFYNYPVQVEHSTFTNLKYIKYPLFGRLYARYLLSKDKVYLPYKNLYTNKISDEVATRKLEESDKGYQKPNDLLQRMLDEGFTLEEITNISLTLTFASVMTITNNLTIAFYDMATYSEYYDELFEEQLQIKKEFGEIIDSDAISKMIKLNSFIRESMRFRIAGITNFRVNKTNWTLSNGIKIPKGSLIGVDAISLHFDNELQDGSPYEFKPFRHANNGKLATKVEPQNISFGLGQHACPGRFLAIQEISTTLAVIIRNYKVSTKDGKPHPYMVKQSQFSLPKGEPLLFTKVST